MLAGVAALLAPGMPGNRYGLLANLVFFLLGDPARARNDK